ncbi:hypothetical protein GCM10009119_19450 [Algoriphagus jejuensis]|uniref:Phage abortive infection protein n=1 Tax=Algoriphagus jejuensis TaxID=419934 RepID=A0ABP3YCZ0_9BACT
MDISQQKSTLNKQIEIFSWIGGISAVFALLPLIWAGYQVLGNHAFFKENELGDFIGGTSGTFASFAGLAFVYVAFLGQRLQILMQQEELESNRQEMEYTRMEIQGQREQLELQNNYIKNEQVVSILFRLIDSFIENRKNVTYLDHINYEKRLREASKHGQGSSIQEIQKYLPERDVVYGNDAFQNIIVHLKEWTIGLNGWRIADFPNFEKVNGFKFIVKPDNFKIDSLTINQAGFIIKAITNEESLGSYLRGLVHLLNYIKNNNLSEFLKVIESQMGKSERVYLFYWINTQLSEELIDFLRSNYFLNTISPKDLLHPDHKSLFIQKNRDENFRRLLTTPK